MLTPAGRASYHSNNVIESNTSDSRNINKNFKPTVLGSVTSMFSQPVYQWCLVTPSWQTELDDKEETTKFRNNNTKTAFLCIAYCYDF